MTTDQDTATAARTRRTTLRELGPVLGDPLSVPCPVCRAAPQMFCRRPDGTVCDWVHRGRDRRAQVRAALAAVDRAGEGR